MDFTRNSNLCKNRRFCACSCNTLSLDAYRIKNDWIASRGINRSKLNSFSLDLASIQPLTGSDKLQYNECSRALLEILSMQPEAAPSGSTRQVDQQETGKVEDDRSRPRREKILALRRGASRQRWEHGTRTGRSTFWTTTQETEGCSFLSPR